MKEYLPASLLVLVLWSIWSFLPKITTRLLPPRSVFVYEMAGALFIGAIVLLSLKGRPDFHPRGALLAFLTGALGVSGGLAYLYAASRGPISVVSVVTALYPAVVVLLAYYFLGEELSARQLVGLVLALISIVLISG